ncbi:MAG TPA: M1 family metallopeptidase [Terracidiphilus sp.]|jgi:aminopeptidase N|nr:M1 family metallopeptidase [Terracidiphilus sp.]
MRFPLPQPLAWSVLFLLAAPLLPAQTAQQTPAPSSPQQQPNPAAQQQPPSPAPAAEKPKPRIRPSDAGAPIPTRYDMLRGAYGPFRSNNDLLYYHLDIRVDPEQKSITGKNTIRFRMLKDGARIQLDLTDKLDIDKILWRGSPLKYERDTGAVFIDFPRTLKAGEVVTIDFYFSGHPPETGRFGAFTFKKDKAGKAWINTACEGTGASIWWPDKDQWRDEVESMDISVAIPNGLMDVSNGKFAGKTDLGDGYTRWDWHVSYPINNYDVSLNIGDYVHWSDKLGALALDFYALPEDLDKAKVQFAQAKGMLEAYQHYFGEYPFIKDGYKLIEAPYSGMEHQSAVTYGNQFRNGYLGRDWTGVGISLRFDFIIIHESGHEWFGNSITAADPSDMWIHEGWTTYLESLYVEYRWGKADALKYLGGIKPKIVNLRPIVAERGVNADPTEDQYFKGALMINTLRSVVNDDAKWFALLHDFYQHFKYRNIMTEDVVAWFNLHTGMNLTPIFDQYLRHAHIPRLELLFGEAPGMVMYKWDADEDGFAMPVRVGTPDHWQIIHPTTKWQWMQTPLSREDFRVATDMYYVDVNKAGSRE